MLWLAVGLGGAVGSVARHAMNIAVHRTLGDSVPYATATANILGCLLIGALAAVVTTGSLRVGEAGRAFLFVGVLGGFTTFSSLGLDTFTLVRGGAVLVALGNVAVQICAGLGAVFVGYKLASW